MRPSGNRDSVSHARILRPWHYSGSDRLQQVGRDDCSLGWRPRDCPSGGLCLVGGQRAGKDATPHQALLPPQIVVVDLGDPSGRGIDRVADHQTLDRTHCALHDVRAQGVLKERDVTVLEVLEFSAVDEPMRLPLSDQQAAAGQSFQVHGPPVGAGETRR